MSSAKLQEFKKFCETYWDLIKIEPEDPRWRNGGLPVVEELAATGGDFYLLARMIKGRGQYWAVSGRGFVSCWNWYKTWLEKYFATYIDKNKGG